MEAFIRFTVLACLDQDCVPLSLVILLYREVLDLVEEGALSKSRFMQHEEEGIIEVLDEIDRPLPVSLVRSLLCLCAAFL